MRVLIAALFAFVPQAAYKGGIASHHRQGPNGLEAWTLSYKVPDSDLGPQPGTLVIARRGRVVRRIDGDPFVWAWMFQDGGRRVAFESGPLHFSLNCVLVDISTGKQVGHYDCFQSPLRENAPAWVKLLENNPRAQGN